MYNSYYPPDCDISKYGEGCEQCIKVFGFFDDWLNKFIQFHIHLEGLAKFYVPLCEIIFLAVVTYYIINTIPRKM